MKLKSVFQVIQGHQITDEEIYKSIGLGNIPIYTSNNEIKGYWGKAIITEQDLPCITYPSKANSGEAFIQNKVFDANNTAVLIPLPAWRDQIILEWAVLKLANTFLRIATSKEGVSYLNKDIVNELEFEVPDKTIQEEELKVFRTLKELNMEFDKILSIIGRINSSSLTIEYQKFQANDVPASEIFSVISGNSGLTEEYLYSMINTKAEKKYKLLTGGIDIQNVQLVPMCPHPVNSNETIKVFKGEGIHVVRKGRAGHISYLPYNDYTLNDDAYLLIKKEDCKLDISLNWLANTYRSLFYEYATKSDNGTWNKTAFFEHALFDIPDRKEQDVITGKLMTLNDFESKLNMLNDKVLSILKRESS